jgi:hypothetical protein
MSLYIKYAHYCDFCGGLIHKESFVIMQGPGSEAPEPRPNNFRTGTHNWDLCATCVKPLRATLDNSISVLRERGELKTITHPTQVEKDQGDAP